ncbi:hypothetical protein N8I74_08675 [Chitiniphilus purpureus]|uniref:Uncharacterized protein n=1 Tax=Chitiniphilus purpureus TaxID=2981137 RepID=A0ABY6DU91_9NEIS|nr:hypothetical protein [Chitiniphilus sp. CD1]UXY17066.1 hypothetical protein N8I74_08675 [Chitiniphilus sp. CD1]
MLKRYDMSSGYLAEMGDFLLAPQPDAMAQEQLRRPQPQLQLLTVAEAEEAQRRALSHWSR